jgi:serine/threonine protein kinase
MIPNSKTTKYPNVIAINNQDIVWGIKIGQGSFGEIYRGTLFGQEVALKKIHSKNELKVSNIKDFYEEIEIMKRIRNHPNIVNFLGKIY